MKQFLPFFLLLTFLISSCTNKKNTENQILQHYFPDKSWEPEQRISFEFDIKDTGVYRCKGNFYFQSVIPFNRIPLIVVLQLPDGSTRYHETHLVLKENAVLKGERVDASTWKIPGEFLPAVNISFTGKHILMMYHTMPVSLDNVMVKVELWFEKIR